MKYRFLLIGFLFLPTVFYGMEPNLEAAEEERSRFAAHLALIANTVTDPRVMSDLKSHIYRVLSNRQRKQLQESLGASPDQTLEQQTILLLCTLHQDFAVIYRGINKIRWIGNVCFGCTAITCLTVTLVLAKIGCWPT